MSLARALRSAVAVAHKVTGSLQVEVTLDPWVGTDEYGKPTFGLQKCVSAIVERRQRMVRTATGEEVLSTCRLTILEPSRDTAIASSLERQQFLDTRDTVTLPDGTTSPILAIEGVIDPSTDRPYAWQVSLA